MNNLNLGKLISVHGVSAALLQRSVIVIIISLFFALAMFVGFLITQKFVLLLLAAAFFAINILTLFSLLAQRKKVLSLYEQGFIYNKLPCRFDEIASLQVKTKTSCQILTTSGEKFLLNESISEIESLISVIESFSAKSATKTSNFL
jgi:hypothetical protein